MKKFISNPDNQHNFNNSLLILDESHFAQMQSSLVHQFITKCVGITMDADINKWKNQNIVFLSVSATPMSELAHLLDDCQKDKLLLTPDNDYYGFEKMIQLQKMKQSFQLSNIDHRKTLIQIIENYHVQQSKTKQYKYIIIRFCNTPKGRVNKDLFKQDISFPVKYINFHSKIMNIKDINHMIKEPPSILTIIEIYHSLRAGIQLNTKHICMIHDSPTGWTDTTAQGLAGRCCGYDKECHQVDVYCNLESIKKYIRLIEQDFEPQYIPSKCYNILKGNQSSNSRPFTPETPQMCILSSNSLKELHQYKEKHRNRYPEFTKLFNYKLTQEIDHFHLNYKILWEESSLVGVTILDEHNVTKTKTNTWVKFWDPAYKAALNQRKGAFFRHCDLPANSDKFKYIYINLKKEHSEYGRMIVTFQRRLNEIERNQIITTGLESFHPNNN